jgi:hypothetical protein
MKTTTLADPARQEVYRTTNATDQPAGTPDATHIAPRLAAGSAHNGRRGHESRHSHHHSTRRALRAALIVSLCTLGLVLLFGWVYTHALRARTAAGAERNAQLETEIAQLKLELESLRGERDALATGKLPGLIPLEFDRAIEPGRPYVRNVIFTQTGTRGDQRYEYRMVIANPGPAPLRPAARLLFFDERGIQVGESDVDRDAAAGASETGAWLQSGETRSYTSVVEMREGATPRYFLLVVQ